MGYGLTVYNNNNEIQIDGKYKNFSLYSSGSWSVSSGFGWYTFSSTANPPILAIRPTTTFCMQAQYKKISNSYTQTKVYADASLTLPYIVFTEAALSEIPSNSYGLVVYNADGDLVFHNCNKWCSIASSTTFLNPMKADCSGAWSSVDVTVENADDNYFILRPLCEIASYNSQQNVTVFFSPSMKKVDSTTIQVAFVSTTGVTGNASSCDNSDNLTLIEIST